MHHKYVIEGSFDRNFGLVFTAFFLVVASLPLIHGNGLRLWALGLAYDNMHFSPAGLHLFAIILADRMSTPELVQTPPIKTNDVTGLNK